MNVLKLDAAGTPQQWLEFDEAAYYLTQGKVAWSIGEPCITLRGGTNAESGMQSTLALPPIMAIRGEVFASRNYRPLSCERPRLFRRDRHVCAYCAQTFRESELTADHVIPESRGGAWSWANLVSSCSSCNGLKADRTPEEAKMPLVYVPYTPNAHEGFLLDRRRILTDQMDFLVRGLPAHSRMKN